MATRPLDLSQERRKGGERRGGRRGEGPGGRADPRREEAAPSGSGKGRFGRGWEQKQNTRKAEEGEEEARCKNEPETPPRRAPP